MQNQRTINKTVSFSGIGLHTGNETTITFSPAPPDTGVVFVRTDLPNRPRIKADVAPVTDVARGTTIGLNGVKVLTVEHVLAAFAGLGIDNIYCEVDASEAPVGDGSALPFVETLTKAGITEQERTRKEVKITEPVAYEDSGLTLLALPSDRLKLSYMIEYGHPVLGTQFRSFAIEPEVFVRDIAPARTFCFLHDVEQLQSQGLIKGGSLNNAIVIGDENILNERLRFSDEFVRHKVLDLLGDLVLLGASFIGHVVAMKAGHASHVELVKQLRLETQPEVECPGRTSPADETLKDVTLNANEIRKILPHRFPFLLVDRITKMGDMCVHGIKNVTISEPFFEGHFPGHPIMPGALIIEAMGQVGGVLVLTKTKSEGKLPYILSIEKAKFRRPIYPGDRMDIEVHILRLHRRYGKLRGEAKVDGKLAAEAEMTFAMPE